MKIKYIAYDNEAGFEVHLYEEKDISEFLSLSDMKRNDSAGYPQTIYKLMQIIKDLLPLALDGAYTPADLEIYVRAENAVSLPPTPPAPRPSAQTEPAPV
jgi:hypothetical protein